MTGFPSGSQQGEQLEAARKQQNWVALLLMPKSPPKWELSVEEFDKLKSEANAVNP
ncbi:MAG: hypothetical protein R3C11_10520 [Planctomycetaceae bacterium]